MENAINVHFSGEGVDLQTFSFKTFSKLTDAYFDVLKRIAGDNDNATDKKALDFCLHSIREGSYLVEFVPIGNDTILTEANVRLQDSIKNGTTDNLPTAAQDALYNMASLANSSNVAIGIQTDSGDF